MTKTGAFHVILRKEHGQSLLNWAVEASEIGLRAGQWPSLFLVTLPVQPQPEVVLFEHGWCEHDGAMQIYQSSNRPGERLTLTVFND